jgi:predicted dehydrogenase
VANLTASRASFQATRKMRLYGPEGYASLDFATKQGTLIRPSETLRRGELELDGLDLSQPAAVRDHVFGKVLRVDKVEAGGREPLALELEDFVRAARGLARPRVDGDAALRAMRLADEVLRSLRAHAWEGVAEVPAGPPAPAPTAPGAGHTLRGPISWRLPGPTGTRPTPSPSSNP